MCIRIFVSCLKKIFYEAELNQSRPADRTTVRPHSSEINSTNEHIRTLSRTLSTEWRKEIDFTFDDHDNGNLFVTSGSIKSVTQINNSPAFDCTPYLEIHEKNIKTEPKTYIFQTKKFTNFQETIIKYLGRGGSAEVTKARDMKKVNYVAIKKFYNKFINHGFEEAQKMCELEKLPLAEGLYLTKIKSIHCDIDRGQRVLILVIDIGVCSLRDIIRKRKEEKKFHNEYEIILIAQNILKGLKGLQKLRIVHGDVKPDNILYCRNPPRYVITDFGESYLSEPGKGANVPGNMGYTEDYLAPWQCCDGNEFARDTWALGVTLLELIEPNEKYGSCGSVSENFKKELQATGLTSDTISKFFKREVISSSLWEILRLMLKLKPEEIPDAESLLSKLELLISQKRSSLKSKAYERKKYGSWSKTLKKDVLKFWLDEEWCAKKIEEQKVVNMSNEFEKIRFLDDFIREYEKLYDWNYCMRLTEKKLEIIKSKRVTDDCPELADSIAYSEESLANTLIELAYYCRLSEYHSVLALNELQKHESCLKTFFRGHAAMESEFLLNLGAIHRNLGNFNEAKHILQMGIEKAWSLSIKELLSVTESEENLEKTRYMDVIGMVFLDTAEYETALNYFKKSLEIKLKVKTFPNKFSVDAQKFVVEIEKSYNNIGLACLKSCRLEEALASLSKNIVVADNRLNDKHMNPDKALTFSLIGKIKEEEGLYSHAYESYNKARFILERLIATREHPQITRIYLDIGNLFEKIGVYNRAIEKYEEALDISKKCFDREENVFIADCNSYLGSVYSKLARFKRAESHYDEALEQYSKVYRPNKEGEIFHQNVAKVFIEKGVLYLEQAKRREAKKYFKKAENMLISLFGKSSHPDEAVALNNLGVLNSRKGKYTDALVLHLDALKIISKVYKFANNKNYHPEVARTLNYIGQIYAECKYYARAEKNYVKAKETFDVFFKDPHPEKAKTIFYRGLLELKKGDESSLEKAKDFISKSLEMLGSLYHHKRDHHPDIIACYMELGAVEQKLKNYASAIDYTQKSINLSKLVYKSEENVQNVNSQNQLALLYFETGYREEAERVLNNAIEIGKRILPELHPAYISLLNTKLTIIKSSNNYEAAYFLSEEIRKLENTRTLMNTVGLMKMMTEEAD